MVRTADRFARDHELHSSILLSSAGNTVRDHGLRLSESKRRDRRRRNALLHEITAHRLRAALRQRLIVVSVADAVGVAVDFEAQVRIRQQDAGDGRQLLARARL